MTIRDTSRQAYHDTSDIRSEKKLKIIEVLRRKGPMTRREISAETGIETSCVAGRVKELIDMGALHELEQTRPCPITHRNVHWVAAA